MKKSLLFGTLLSVATLTGCSLDIGNGSQLTGQRCFQDSDCSEGLTCSQRICVASFGSSNDPDAGNNDNNGGNNDNNGGNNANNGGNNANNGGNNANNGGNNANNGGNNDNNNNRPCDEGEVRCAGPDVVQICVGDGRVVEEPCPPETVCQDGGCVEIGEGCRDFDGDGYGAGCDAGFDCDDRDPSVNPGARENCNNGLDDNCNGRVNEGCMTNPDVCNGMDCADGEFCNTDNVCVPFTPEICEWQNQPCAFEGEFTNGFGCFAFNPGDEPRCWGICAINANDPDSTCPDPNSVCAFDSGDGQNGICLSACGVGADGVVRECGPSDLGCLNIDVSDGEGVCVPVDPDNGRNERCNEDYLFDCAEGLICVPGRNGSRCREACRPYAYNGMGTDCDQGHCLAYSAAIGVCVQDNNSTEGEACAPQASACNEDAVGCYNVGNGQECTRICRLDEGNGDCNLAGQTCQSFDPQNTELGVCIQQP